MRTIIKRLSSFIIRNTDAGANHNTSYEGHLDYVERFGPDIYASGWVWNPGNPSESVTAYIVSGRHPVAEVTGNMYRNNLEKEGKGNGHHAFKRVYINKSLANRHIKSLRLLPHESDSVIRQNDLEIIPCEDTTIKGRIDSVEIFGPISRISGWIWEPGKPDNTITASIISKDRMLTTFNATEYREDLEKAGMGNGQHAFTVIIETKSPEETNELQLSAAADNILVLQKGEYIIKKMPFTHPEAFKLIFKEAVDQMDNGNIEKALTLYSYLLLLEPKHRELDKRLQHIFKLKEESQIDTQTNEGSKNDSLQAYRQDLKKFNLLLNGMDQALKEFKSP